MSKMKVVILGFVWPEITSSAAGLRAWNLVDTFLKEGWSVTYGSPSKESVYSEKLKERGVRVAVVQPNDSSFDHWIKVEDPHFVVFDRFMMEEQFGWRVEENCPQSIRILDTVDLHFLRRGRQRALEQGATLGELAQTSIDLVSDDFLREIGSIYRCDLSLILSSFEMDLLEKRFGVLPHNLLLNRFFYPETKPQVSFHARKNFVMMGNFRHAPNVDGMLWFRKEVWPSIRATLPESEVHIYGAYPTREIMNLSQKNLGFYVMGSSTDQYETFAQYRVNLAPLRFGAGIKGKISDGWLSGTPVVTTPIGAEGMIDSDQDWGGLISQNADEFAQHAIQLHTHEELWNRLSHQSIDLVKRYYSPKNGESLIECLYHLKNQVSEVRKKNWVGSVLRYHHHRSTKYFSKWIEEKNRARSIQEPSPVQLDSSPT